MHYLFTLIILLAQLGGAPIHAMAAESKPITTDSRIKTYVYNENEVFQVTVHFGYQSYIQFGDNEKIENYSLGNNTPWKISTVRNKLFLTPIDGYAHTNMTVITNLRSYQFDLESKTPSEEEDNNLTYIVRFYYPDDSFDRVKLSGPKDQYTSVEVPLSAEKSYNFSYSFVGPDQFAPIKIFDDGVATYFELQNFNTLPPPSIAIVNFNGSEIPISGRQHSKYVVVDRIAGQFAIRYGQTLICVFNENNYSQRR